MLTLLSGNRRIDGSTYAIVLEFVTVWWYQSRLHTFRQLLNL
jgi:hypothetical protein